MATRPLHPAIPIGMSVSRLLVMRWGPIRKIHNYVRGRLECNKTRRYSNLVRIKPVLVDTVNRFSLDIDEESGRTFVSIPVRNSMAEYDEWYEVDAETFEKFRGNMALALELVGKAKRREVDHLLLFHPGADRGIAD